jgi:hypothetical protein
MGSMYWDTVAAWVQALGSIAAIATGFRAVYVQNNLANNQREKDRADRAEVVAFRLSGWLGEVGARLKLVSDWYDNYRKHNRKMLQTLEDITDRLKFNLNGRIDNVMPDLHYLKAGTGDIVQLDYFLGFFDNYLHESNASSFAKMSHGQSLSEAELAEFYDEVETYLKNLRQLYSNAERHLEPLIQGAVRKKR